MGPLQDFSVKDINLTQLRICQQWVLDVLIIFVLLCPLDLPLTLHDILDVNVAELHVLHIWRQITHIHSQSKKMPKIDTLDALEEHEEHEDDYQTNSNW